jgi:hypothetical protein|tara:strand:- start:5675 stop:6589 length:915 start_codon:yes stop_codon:yes gene_type:complete
MASYTRSSAYRGGDVVLSIQYYGPDGIIKDADETPSIQIKDLNGSVVISATKEGVARAGVGLYQYTYSVASDASTGLWSDTWSGAVSGARLENTFNFLVVESSSAARAGNIKLADDVNFDFSDAELKGINILLKFLKARLRSDGKKPIRDEYGAFVTDGYGNMKMADCNVFSDEILACFLCQSLSEFNMIPFFTSFTFSDQIIYTTFSAAVVEGAYIFALASQALLEKGRDFTISDGGVSYQPPQLGDFLQSQFGTWLSSYRERLKFIKMSIRPGPQSFGTFTNLSSGAPAFVRLRHLRSRKII